MATTRFGFLRRRAWLAAGLAAALVGLLAAGCNPMRRGDQPGGGPGGTGPADLPAEVQAWYEANHETQGTYRLNHGGKTYILVAWGEKPTGGYTVEITGFEEQREVMVAKVKLVAPGPNDMVTQALTYPAALVVLPETQKLFAYEFEGAAWVQEAKDGDAARAVPLAGTEVFIELPAPGAAITNPAVIRGVARMYEATMMVTLEDGHVVLAEQLITLSDGGPAWGTFEIALSYDPPTQAHGMLIFWHEDAADGRRIEDLGVPVKFGGN